LLTYSTGCEWTRTGSLPHSLHSR